MHLDRPVVLHVHALERVRIDENRRESREVFRLSVEQQDAGRARHGIANLIIDLLSATANEVLLGEEHVDVPVQLLPEIVGQKRVEADIACEDSIEIGAFRVLGDTLVGGNA